MADALILCPEAPYPVVGGGPLRTACMVEYLASRYELDVITFREPGAPDPREAFPLASFRNFSVIDLPHHSKQAHARVLRNVGRLMRNAPPLVDRFAGFDLPVRGKYDVAVIEHFWCAPYVDHLRGHCSRIVLNLHNVESVLLERCAATESALGGAALRRFARACARLERELLPKFDDLLVCSESDRSQVGRGTVWPNAIGFVSQLRPPRRNAIVFSGNMAYHPNIAAVQYFAAEIWPLIRENEPEIVWELIGKNPESLRLPPDPRMRIVGPVEDAVAAMAGARAAVVPILSGSGTRFKILEAWAAGIPVVSTTLGAEGLQATHGEHLLIADDPVSFADAVKVLLKDEALAHRIGHSGRQLYESAYTWPVAWKILQAAGL